MFEVVKDDNGKLQLKISAMVSIGKTAASFGSSGKVADEKCLVTAASVIRTLTALGHQKNLLPLEAVFHHYNTLVYLRDGLAKYKLYAKKFNEDPSHFSALQLVEEKLNHRRLLQSLATLGSKIPDISTYDEKALRIIGLDDLIKIVEMHYQKEFEMADSLKAAGKTTQNALFRIFPPGEVVVGFSPTLPNVKLCYRVTASHYEAQKTLFGSSSSFHVGLEFIASLGSEFVLLEYEETFSSHDNSKEVFIADLHVRPASADEKRDFLERGKKFVQYSLGASYLSYAPKSFFPLKSYNGPQNAWSAKAKSQGALSSGGRIMVDALKGLETGFSVSTGVISVDAAVKIAYSRLQAKAKDSSSNKTADAMNFSAGDDLSLFKVVPDAFIPYALPVAIGFSFNNKAWGQVLVEECSPIHFNKNAFDMLVMSEERKEMIKALITTHEQTTFSSVIQGKGEGICLLLYGSPGTGKTLTAEAIAEYLQRPLFVVSLGDLGITPQELESSLQAILNLCESWKALVLLDEADVFVEKRSRGEILRNSMVGVILRLTEYHRGVIFFTSNRVSSFDPAFQSRVTVAMRFKSLDAEDRAKIWRNLLSVAGVSQQVIGTLDIQQLSRHDLNGRQIKNTVQLALALTHHRGTQLTQQALDSTIKICLDFTSDLNVDDFENDQKTN
ncbi:hypothetical protein MIR68_011016 [Amoeboaphelidium protococcarum]|nr:hypothetical protein MIR68_011016 [Amoeboaphelidium protococcarum]